MYALRSATPAPAWSSSAQLLAMVVCGEAAASVLILAQGAPGVRLALVAGLTAVITVPLIIRAEMPMAVKTLLASATITATLAVAVGADLLGFRTVERAIVEAPVKTGPAAIETIAPTTPTARPAYLTIRGSGDPVSDRIADDLADAMRAATRGGDLPEIEGRISHHATGFAMRWGMTRGTVRRHCGDVRVFGESRDVAVIAFRDALIGAIDASRHGPLACA